MPAVTAEVTSIALVVLFDNAARMLLTSTVEVDAVELAKSELRVELVLIAATFSLEGAIECMPRSEAFI
jgi:hypothetical protein